MRSCWNIFPHIVPCFATTIFKPSFCHFSFSSQYIYIFCSFHSHSSEMCALQDCPSDQTCHTVPYVFVFELPIRGCRQDGKLKVTAPCLASHGLFTLTFLPLRFMLTHRQLAIRFIPCAIPLIDWFHHTHGAHACDFCSCWETGSLPTATLGYEATFELRDLY